MKQVWLVITVFMLALRPPATAGDESLTAGIAPEVLRKAEDAVDRGLDWLSTQQNADGTFSGYRDESSDLGSRTFLAAYAVLSFLSRGHQPDHGPHGRVLARSIDWLLSIQRADGSFSERPPKELPYFHAHAVAGLALSEAYACTSETNTKRAGAAIERALAYSGKMQQTTKLYPEYVGGWFYADNLGPDRSHLSYVQTTCLELTFLRSAQNAGFKVPQAWVDDGLEFIARCYRSGPLVVSDRRIHVGPDQGVFESWPRKPPDMPTWANFKTTAGGMLSFQYHGGQDNPMVQRAANWIAMHPLPPQGSLPSVYHAWYLTSQAMAQVGGKGWQEYYPKLVRILIPHQDRDGRWRLDRAIGWCNEPKLGPAYYTSVAVLCLTMPDQLLPIHQR